MHAAPPVRMSLAGDSRWQVFVTASAGAALGNLSIWIASLWQPPAAALALVALVSAAAGAGLAWRTVRRNAADRGVLAWDGAIWLWAPAETTMIDPQPAVGDARVMVDLGVWMLLRFEAAPPALAVLWLPVSRRRAGPAWPHWRAALFSRRAADAAEPDLS